MKNRFTGDVKVIEVKNPLGYSVGTIRRGMTPKGYVYFARSGFYSDEVFFQTEKAARMYLIDQNEAESNDVSIEEYLRTMAPDLPSETP